MGSNGTGKDVKVSELVNWLPKQQAAWDAMFTHSFVFYGGSRGPGKSYWLRWGMLLFTIYLGMRHKVQGVHTGLFCETYPELRDRHISKIKTEFPLWLGETKSTQEDGLGFHIRPQYGGGVMLLRNLDDPSKYQSAEFAGVAVDELTKIPVETFDVLRGSKRWPGVDHTIFTAAGNPGGIGHLWVKQYFIDKDLPPELRDRADQFAFFKALPKDNPYLLDDYWDELNSLPPHLYKAWVEGDWDSFVGQALPAWRNDRHVIDPFEIPEHWPLYRAIDWGFSAPFVCLWLAKDPLRQRNYVYREVWAKELSDREQALLIKELTQRNEIITRTYADPSMWQSRQYVGLTTSTADEYMAEGVPLTRADNDRLSGKRKIDRLLMDLPDGIPGLQIFSNCKNLIRTLPALPFDDHRKEDVDTDAEDHGYDALRYGLTDTGKKPRPPRVQQRSPMEQLPNL